MFILRFVLQSLITAAATIQLINDSTERRDLVIFIWPILIRLGIVSETVSDEFVIMHVSDCVHVHVCLFVSFGVDN